MAIPNPDKQTPRYIDAQTAAATGVAEDYYNDMGCFLWSVYDKYNDPLFLAPKYDGADNDDIGEPLLAFNTIESLSGVPTDRQFANDLEAAVSTDEAASIEDIYQFTMGNGSHKMRPAQVTDLSGSIAHGDGFDMGVYKVTLSWTPQAYTSGSYINPASGIHVKQSTDGGTTWSLIQTLAAGATSTSFDILPSSGYFKVSTYNSSGDSYAAPTVGVSYDFGGKVEGVGQTPSAAVSGLSITVHPSPATNAAMIGIENLTKGLPAYIEVVDATGKSIAKLYDGTPSDKTGLQLTYDCSKLASGTYYIHVRNAIEEQTAKMEILK
jgi:hypothetical protein